jgi:O-acetyl-ADP-ribose deacetylase (regulator of RNase III)
VSDKHQTTFLDERVKVLVGDLTLQDVAAIVNAANSSLLGGGGVDGAIHRSGGPQILAECRELRRTLYPQGLPTGEAVITTAGLLRAQHVIHTVGPIYGTHRGREVELLANCYRNSLLLAAKYSLPSIAFPAISTGVYDYPRSEAAAVSSRTIKEFLAGNDTVREVRLIFLHAADCDVFLKHQVFS